MWNLLRRTRKNQKSGRDVREVGWRSLFQAVAEPFAGAWQQGVKADPGAVLSFRAAENPHPPGADQRTAYSGLEPG